MHSNSCVGFRAEFDNADAIVRVFARVADDGEDDFVLSGEAAEIVFQTRAG